MVGGKLPDAACQDRSHLGVGLSDDPLVDFISILGSHRESDSKHMTGRNYTFLGICAIALIGLTGCGATSATDTASDSIPVPSEARMTEAGIETLATAVLGAKTSDDKSTEISAVRFGSGDFGLTYYTPTVFGEDEVVRALAPVFESFFANPKARSLMVQPTTDLVSTGGKESVGNLFTLTCDRAASDEIDWQAVDEDGIKQVCDYELLVTK